LKETAHHKPTKKLKEKKTQVTILNAYAI